MTSIAALRDWLAAQPQPARAELIRSLALEEQRALKRYWKVWARPEQQPPAGDWSTWLVCAGRGFGKSRAGAEWVCQLAAADADARIALVGSSLGEARAVMVEGESGVLACMRRRRRRVTWEPSLRRLTFATGAQALLYSAGEPETLRGPQHSHAWCDEIGKWEAGRALETWDNLVMGLRLGEQPQALATTTPRATPLLLRLFAEAERGEVALVRGSTFDNADNLPHRFVRDIRMRYGHTAIGRQELSGELLTDVEGALWSRTLLERCREEVNLEGFVRVVVGVDPPASSRGDECGIVVVGLTEEGRAKVVADCSIRRPSPERWSREVARAALDWNADRVVAEANQGGDMVRSVLHAVDAAMPVQLVHASRGKAARAEPVAALYETGRVIHVGMFGKLEDQLCGLMTGGSYEGPGRSPDRADALVWALTELMLGKRGAPRVRGF
ncbi:DNA-packaging protein [Aurantiacibacter luteus]|uniref:ATP-binding protein n=1 Tax=Aurantiacibacter luteus TaxID=1581420 RepID=A0A0G9MUS0_9SPHN|nr:terminase family protein [Aurantiacibacter luteus]KLE34471.1 ATP-binding protein [Aurantiacibacter luteus]